MLLYTKKCIVLDVITITKVKSIVCRYYFCPLQKKGNNIIHLFWTKKQEQKNV